MRRSLTVLTLVLAVLIAACGNDEPNVVEDAEPDDGPTPTETEEPTAPLTGLPVDDEAVLERPVLAVKVDNHPDARPQEGIDGADVVMVETVEGFTRFIALFQSTAPERVGPVRSGRFVDTDLLPAFEPAFAISGAAEPVLAQLQASDMELYGEGSAGAWTRESARPAPHNLFLATEAMFEAAADDGVPPATQPWPYDADATADAPGGEVGDVELSYPDADSVSWAWDGEEFVRSQDGQPHELAGGEQVAADNVVIVRVPTTGDPTRPFDPVGSGELTVLRDGRELTGTWEKDSATAQFRWLDADGEPLPLAPGTSWIELVPSDGTVTIGEDG